ncbi:MAG: hypothetical protein ACYTGV_08440 [Planctomycetota bacterium]|jgi:hypothetical protein
MGLRDRSLWFLLIVAGCAYGTHATAPSGGAASDYLPFERGRTWVYEVRDPAGKVFRLSAKVEGGDVRSLNGDEGVRFQFVYGTPEGARHEVTKSIYALPSTGPCEYYLDAMRWALWHDPPIPLLPSEVVVGREVSWKGLVEFADGEIATTARIQVKEVELLLTPAGMRETARTRTTYDALDLEVTRWIARGIGLVRVEVRAGDEEVGMRVLSHLAPDPQ